MNLVKDVVLSCGITIPSAVIKIDAMNISTTLNYQVSAYNNDGNGSLLFTTTLAVFNMVPDFSDTAEDFFTQAYNDLITRDGFQDAQQTPNGLQIGAPVKAVPVSNLTIDPAQPQIGAMS